MIPEQFVEWSHGISGIAFFVNGFICLVLGYLIKDVKDTKSCHSKRISAMEKCLAVMKERDEGIKTSIDDIKKNLDKLFEKMDQVRVAVAKLDGNRLTEE